MTLNDVLSIHTMCGQGSTKAMMGVVPETPVQPPGASQSGSSVAADRGITGRGYLTEAPDGNVPVWTDQYSRGSKT